MRGGCYWLDAGCVDDRDDGVDDEVKDCQEQRDDDLRCREHRAGQQRPEDGPEAGDGTATTTLLEDPRDDGSDDKDYADDGEQRHDRPADSA